MRLRVIATATGAALALLLLLFGHRALPPTLGGETTYLRIVGNSMLPGLVAGDVVGVRPTPPYGVGDAVAYRNPDLGVVVHRIVSWDGNELVLQGDHNNFTDGYHATQEDVIGTIAYRLPGAMRYLPNSPLTLPILLAIPTLLASAFRAWHVHRRQSGGTGAPQRVGTALTARPLMLAACSAALLGLLVAVALQVIGRTTPQHTVARETTAVRHSTTLLYGSGVTMDPAKNGFPVFRSDGGSVPVQITYHAEAPVPLAIEGTIMLTADVQLANGWHETVPIVPSTPFSGLDTFVTGTFDLMPVWTDLDQLAARTGVDWGSARVTIRPEVQLSGRAASSPIRETIGQPVEFTLDKRQLRLDDPAHAADHLQFSATTAVSQQRVLPATAPILHWSPTRVITLANLLLIGSLLVLGGTTLWDASERRHRRRAWEHARLGHALTRGTLASIGVDRTVVEVDSLHALIAARGSESVFLDETAADPVYFVLRDGTAYLYRDVTPFEGQIPVTLEPRPHVAHARGDAQTGRLHVSSDADIVLVPDWLIPPGEQASGERLPRR